MANSQVRTDGHNDDCPIGGTELDRSEFMATYYTDQSPQKHTSTFMVSTLKRIPGASVFVFHFVSY